MKTEEEIKLKIYDIEKSKIRLKFNSDDDANIYDRLNERINTLLWVLDNNKYDGS